MRTRNWSSLLTNIMVLTNVSWVELLTMREKIWVVWVVYVTHIIYNQILYIIRTFLREISLKIAKFSWFINNRTRIIFGQYKTCVTYLLSVCSGCDFFEHSSFLHLHKTVLNLFSFASPCFIVICVFDAKKVISLDGRTFTHYKVTIFYLCVRKFYMSTQIIFHLELYLC
jgi:hypothetical protein